MKRLGRSQRTTRSPSSHLSVPAAALIVLVADLGADLLMLGWLVVAGAGEVALLLLCTPWGCCCFCWSEAEEAGGSGSGFGASCAVSSCILASALWSTLQRGSHQWTHCRTELIKER